MGGGLILIVERGGGQPPPRFVFNPKRDRHAHGRHPGYNRNVEF
jgi:hypothetical protein